MAHSIKLLPLFLLIVLALAEATPPGLERPSNAGNCGKYKYCNNLEHVCPKFCPNGCYTECVSCKPICNDGLVNPPYSHPPPPYTHVNPPPYSHPPPPYTHVNPPPYSHPPPPYTPTPTPPVQPTPPTPSTPTPPAQPPTSPTPSSSDEGTKRAKCKNNKYPHCYNTEHMCPSTCPRGCEVDCVTCKPICNCDKPGAVCQDPRFIGGDGVTFYFHGKKERDFCLISDSNLHINAHFIGKRNENMKRDFTWVQSIGILFDKHQLFIGAQRTATWDDANDRVELSYDGQPIALPEISGAKWQSGTVSITRASDTNNVVIEVQGNFKITAKIVPITEKESMVHNYGITKDDCFAHLDLGFKLFSLSNEVHGVLGQTYRPAYVSGVKIGAKMPVMGGDDKFETSGLFATDCKISRFNGGKELREEPLLELPSMSCSSGLDGKGVVCKR